MKLEECCVPPPKLICLSSVGLSGYGAFGRCLGHVEGGILMSGLNALVRGYSHRILVTFLSREATRRSLQPGREPSPHCAPAHAQVLIHVLLLCDPMDCSPPSSSVHGLSRQEYWSGLPFPSPGDLPNLGVKPTSPALQVDSLPLSH